MVGLHYLKIVLTLKLVCVCSRDNIKICGLNSNRYLQHLLTYGITFNKKINRYIWNTVQSRSYTIFAEQH